jgi:hypothetical protein
MCILLRKYFARQIYSCSFHISKLNDLKVIHDLYSQYLTQIMSKTTSFTKPEGVLPSCTSSGYLAPISVLPFTMFSFTFWSIVHGFE